MKTTEDDRTRKATIASNLCHPFIRMAWTLALFLVSANLIWANDFPFGENEEIEFEVKYKYGIVMAKAATIKMKVSSDCYEGIPAYKSELFLRTTSFFDGIYKMRDTLISYSSIPSISPLYHFRSVNEGSTHFWEKQFVLEHSKTQSAVRVIRMKHDNLSFDSIIYTPNEGFDIPNLLLHIRNMDHSRLVKGDSFRMTTFLGKRQTSVICIYRGVETIQRGKKKYKTHKFDFDVANEAFSEAKRALELWIGDDANKLPIKLKAKLKIGAAEAFMTSAKNTKYPLDAETGK